MSIRELWGWPGPLWPYPVTALLMTVATGLSTQGRLDGAYPLWVLVSADWHESLWISGAVLAAWCAFVGSLLYPAEATTDQPLRPRVNFVLLGRRATPLAAWAMLGHALGLAPIHFSAWVGATHGHLKVTDVLIGLAGIVVWVVLGLAVAGVLGRALFAVPVAGLLSYVIAVVPMSAPARPLALFLPVRHEYASPRFHSNPYTAAFALLATLLVCGAISAGVAWWRSRRTVRRDGIHSVAWAGAVVVVLVIAFAWRPELYVASRPGAPDCVSRASVRICVHPANTPAVADISRVVDRVARSGLGGQLTSVTDEAADSNGPARADEVLLDVAPGPFATTDAVQSVEEQAAFVIIQHFASGRCTLRPGEPQAQSDLVYAIGNRVLVLAGYPRLAEGLQPAETPAVRAVSQLKPDQIEALFEREGAAIARCALKPEDIPR